MKKTTIGTTIATTLGIVALGGAITLFADAGEKESKSKIRRNRPAPQERTEPAPIVDQQQKLEAAEETLEITGTPRPTGLPLTKDIVQQVERGLDWLITRQQKNGGWGPGHQGPGAEERPTVGNTCIALQAFHRAGYGPSDDHQYAESIRKGLQFVFSQIEDSDRKSLFITPIRDSQLQSKLGTYVDTFLTSTVLPDFKGRMPDEKGESRLEKNLNKVLAKMEANQAEDGSWKQTGWATQLAQGYASKGLNKAAQAGFTVSEPARTKAEKFSRRNFDAATGDFAAEGTAGVALYGGASNLAAIQDSSNTNQILKPQLQVELAKTTDKEKRRTIETKLSEIQACEADLEAAQKAVVKRLADPAYVAGFGNNGGEEFLSYLNIGESLRIKGGKDWKKFRNEMVGNLGRTQEDDGCWKGKHCITGGTFCTSTGLLVMMLDRAPLPENLTVAKAEEK